jgi:hypothetical protein
VVVVLRTLQPYPFHGGVQAPKGFYDHTFRTMDKSDLPCYTHFLTGFNREENRVTSMQ